MRMKLRNIAAAAVLLSVLCLQRASAQGLGFHGMECVIDDRTSWNVFGEKSESFTDDFRMDFDLYTRPEGEFGYFFRLKYMSGSGRIWNLSYDSRGEDIVVRLNEEGRYSLIRAEIAHEKMKHLHWHSCSVDFDLGRDSVSLKIGREEFRAACPGLPDRIAARIEFGRSDHIIDVPGFSIRDLKVGNSRKIFIFPLSQRSGNTVRDSSGKIRGKVLNPEWLVNDALEWKKIAEFSFNDIAGAAYNSVRKEFCYFTEKEMTVLSLMSDSRRDMRFSSPCPVQMKLGNNCISEDGKYLFVYELYNEDVDQNSPSVARYDFDSGEWKVLCRERLDMPMHHHGCFRNPATGQYTILGGFGNMLYNGRFFAFDSASGHWIQQHTDSESDPIYPRYFTSTGTDSTYIYVYGGMGNECGEQVVGRRYFYDLHRVDPLTGRSELLWERKNEGQERVPVRSLCVDGGYFYTLTYPEYISKSELYLSRFSISDGTEETFGDSIPIISDKMRTNANIYLDKELGRFFVTVQEFEDDIKSCLKIYSLAYPPISKDEAALLDEASDDDSLWSSPWLWTVTVLLLAGGSGTYIYIIRRKRMENEALGEGRGTSAPRKIFRNETGVNSIYIFGDFTVIDREGNEITTMFKNQQILILCLLIKRGASGISTKRLSSILWPDKEEEKVKNSRGVAINNLRKALSGLDGVGVAYRDGRYYLETSDESRCDYLELCSLLNDKQMNRDRILEIISRGKFLKGVGDEIFDDFKEKVENILMPLLQEEMALRFKEKEYEAVCEIGDMIAEIDPTDETALRTVIQTLRRQKRTEEALVRYASFCSEYKKENGTDYPLAFKNI